jgi:hypothetical protein
MLPSPYRKYPLPQNLSPEPYTELIRDFSPNIAWHGLMPFSAFDEIQCGRECLPVADFMTQSGNINQLAFDPGLREAAVKDIENVPPTKIVAACD